MRGSRGGAGVGMVEVGGSVSRERWVVLFQGIGRDAERG